MPDSFLVPEPLHLVHTFENGQCFRWRRLTDTHYIGVVGGEILEIESIPEGTRITSNAVGEDRSKLLRYFGFGEGRAERQEKLSRKDAQMKRAYEFCAGMAILRQDPWETLLVFILSQNNHMTRIRSLTQTLAREWGRRLEYTGDYAPLQGEAFYSFPTPQELAQTAESELRERGFGYRAGYIVDAVRKVIGGELDLGALYAMREDEAREELKKIRGVGDKVANCVLLFAYGFHAAAPIDVWVARALDRFYAEEMKGYKNRASFIADYFGEEAGMAQQMLFYTIRSGRYE